MSKREYTRDGLTVLWNSELCVHCKACWLGLPKVFDPDARPWVNMDGAPLEEIKKQVDQCPSGALAWKEGNDV